MKMMTLQDILSTADLWEKAGGSKKIEIGALEPLLWKNENFTIVDLVSRLTNKGFIVNMTSNGQLLHKFNQGLLDAGLNKLRVSWHTMNPLLFKELSGGYGDYSGFLKNIENSLNIGLKISFNRVLLKNHTQDIQEQVDVIDKYGSRLKLYPLMWTPENKEHYKKFFIDWQPVINNISSIESRDIINNKISRDRLQFKLPKGGVIEVKISETINREKFPCNTCDYRKQCEEEFGDYARVDPNLLMYFCYMRKDLGFILNLEKSSDSLQTSVKNYINIESLSDIPLRLTISPFCNFNCRIPGTKNGWCMESNDSYTYPKIRNSLF